MTLKEFVDRVEENLAAEEYPREELEAIVTSTLGQLHLAPEEVGDLLPQFIPRSRLSI